jgi:hypothetical protein
VFLVLDRQNALANAQFEENRAIADYNVAVANLQIKKSVKIRLIRVIRVLLTSQIS